MSTNSMLRISAARSRSRPHLRTLTTKAQHTAPSVLSC